jgi:hypothetical protein
MLIETMLDLTCKVKHPHQSSKQKETADLVSPWSDAYNMITPEPQSIRQRCKIHPGTIYLATSTFPYEIGFELYYIC